MSYCNVTSVIMDAVLVGFRIDTARDEYSRITVELFCKFHGNLQYKYYLDSDELTFFNENIGKPVYYQLKGSYNGSLNAVDDLRIGYIATPQDHHSFNGDRKKHDKWHDLSPIVAQIRSDADKLIDKKAKKCFNKIADELEKKWA